jgi:hypothetical protein
MREAARLPEPISLGDGRVAADGIILICYPDYQDYVEGSRGVIEELGHYCFHPCNKSHLQLKLGTSMRL